VQRIDEESQPEEPKDDAGHSGQGADAYTQQADDSAAGGKFAPSSVSVYS